MKCNLCKKREAVFHMQEQSQFGVRTVSLCLECAAMKGLNIRSEDVGKLFSAFIANIFGTETERSVNAAAMKLLNLKCSSCGKTLEAISETNEAGCPECFTNFYSFIDMILFKLNHSLDYKGDLPQAIKEKRNYKIEIINLKRQLKQCITLEDFHKAAEIRDKIKELRLIHDQDKLENE